MRLFVFLLVITLCPSAAWAYGETPEDRPSPHERAVHFFTDQLRVEPGAHDAQFERDALRPLVHQTDLMDAARFYADDMSANGCFPADHSSCDGTSAADRISSFYSGPGWAENIAWGSPDAWSVVYDGWLYSSGHRRNMLSGDLSELGTGYARDGGPYWVQDFGMGAPEVEPFLTSGTHWPLRPNAGDEVELHVAVYDANDDSPESVHVDFAGSCRALELDRGGAGKETWTRNMLLPDGSDCVPYVFTAVDASGITFEYPSTGSLLIPTGNATCPSWQATRVGSDCVDAAGETASDDGAFAGQGSGCGSPGEGTDPNGNVTDRVEYASCTAAGAPGPSWAMGLMLLGALRRRRPRPRPD